MKPQRPPLPREALLNMETSELAFNERVLELAEDARVPLLERVRFLSIMGANLDQFFMTRAAGFKHQLAVGSQKRTLDGLSPAEQLALIAERTRGMVERAYRLLHQGLLPELHAHGIELLRWAALGEEDRAYLRRSYATHLEATLDPRPSAAAGRFPHVRNLRPALAVLVRGSDGRDFLSAVELPGDVPRFLPLPGGRRFVPLEELILQLLPALYPGAEVQQAHAFRVMRSGNLQLRAAEGEALLHLVEEEVARRPFRAVVRLEVEHAMPEAVCRLLLETLRAQRQQEGSPLDEGDVYPVEWLVDLHGLKELANLPLGELHYPPLAHRSPFPAERPVMDVLGEQEVFVCFPQDSFEATVERFIAEAADDPQVRSVQITLYRTNRSSRVVKLLRRARRKGKHVLAMVEITASFDERRNIEFARMLEAAGIRVVFGPPRLKVHAKTALVEREEEGGLRRYVYIGTGNLNAATAAAYTDLGLLTADPALAAEVAQVFQRLAGDAGAGEYRSLLVAPEYMRDRFLEMVEREIEHARAGRGGHLQAKINGLADHGMIDALYRASQAGVKIELAVRGLCALRPGVPGLSENISVVSVLGRFLEHSRIYRFANAGQPEYFIGSADWRTRNLSRRVEVVAPVRNQQHRATLDAILAEKLGAPDGWELRPDGSYQRRPGEPRPLARCG